MQPTWPRFFGCVFVLCLFSSLVYSLGTANDPNRFAHGLLVAALSTLGLVGVGMIKPKP